MWIIAFDPIPLDDVYVSILMLENSEPYTEEFESMGYETFYSVKNFGSLFVIGFIVVPLTAFICYLLTFTKTSCA